MRIGFFLKSEGDGTGGGSEKGRSGEVNDIGRVGGRGDGERRRESEVCYVSNTNIESNIHALGPTQSTHILFFFFSSCAILKCVFNPFSPRRRRRKRRNGTVKSFFYFRK